VPADRLMHTIYQEIEDRWRSAHADIHCEVSPRDDFHRMLFERETLAQAKTTDGLQPQLGILEFGLEWLSYVHVALAQKDGMGPTQPEASAAWALTGSAVSFGLSIRSLCINGFDTPARALLRTYVETLFLCLALLYDRSLAEEYAAAATDAAVKNFWHTSASPKNLHQRIITIEKSMEFDDAGEFPAWRRREYEILSQSSHLSFIAAALTSMSPQLGEPGKFSPAIFGLASHSR
jgi:hypothetical protein